MVSAQDFSSIKIQIEVKNLTTGLKFRDHPPTSLCELDLDHMVLDTPARSCSVGHQLLVNLSASAPDESRLAEFHGTAKVLELETGDKDNERVAIQMVQFEQKQWNGFTELFNKRQEAISKLLWETKR